MFLHLGQDTITNTRDIIGIFDLDTTSVSSRTREYLGKAEKAGAVVNVSTELPKSFVVVSEEKRLNRIRHKRGATVGQRLFISQLAAPTLKKRLEQQARQSKQLLQDNK